jgi:hypothetical protein
MVSHYVLFFVVYLTEFEEQQSKVFVGLKLCARCLYPKYTCHLQSVRSLASIKFEANDAPTLQIKNYLTGLEALPSDYQRTMKLTELRVIELDLQKRNEFGAGTAVKR